MMTISPLFIPSEPPPPHTHPQKEGRVPGKRREERSLLHSTPPFLPLFSHFGMSMVGFSVSSQVLLVGVCLNLHSVLLTLLSLTGPGVSTGRRGWARAWCGWAPARASGWRGSAARLAIDDGVGGGQGLRRGEPAGLKRPRRPLPQQRPGGWAEAPRPKLW